MSEATGEWFVSREGQRFGPVSFEDLVKSAKAGRLEPRTDLVFGGRMSDWQPAGEVDGLFEKRGPEEFEEEGDKPYEPPSDAIADSGSYDFGKQAKIKYPGAGRLGYFFGTSLLPFVVVLIVGFLTRLAAPVVGPDIAQWMPLLTLAAPVLVVMVVVNRLHNIQMSGWWTLASFVPILSMWIGYRLFACPPGYALTKKMDGIGIFLAILYWGSILLWIGVMVAAFMGVFGAFADPERMQEIIQQMKNQVPAAPAPKG